MPCRAVGFEEARELLHTQYLLRVISKPTQQTAGCPNTSMRRPLCAGGARWVMREHGTSLLQSSSPVLPVNVVGPTSSVGVQRTTQKSLFSPVTARRGDCLNSYPISNARIANESTRPHASCVDNYPAFSQ